ncbi:beta-glucosidase 12 [Manihot esculenta]|uniref:Uncharacterized protein n=2 Tax=Manihot esculenta TaxID=3983 RepID=A0ACB7H2A8_MANES|nr:beta-glucosidase 12 [Manihot esculenta]KAG8646341.1 hypothetical protein MANES_10G146900v8 [Manihot esculenta]
MAMTMVFKHSLPLAMLVFLVGLLPLTEPAEVDDDCPPHDFNKSYFPQDFIFGTASSAYQIEGGTNQAETGRGPSVWDTYAHESPDRIKDGKNGDVAVDFFHRYKEDIQNVKNMGFKAFRMSISWSRIVPTGSVEDGLNEQGLAFYEAVIDEIKKNELEPFVTIFHWDTPQALEDKYGGFLSRSIVNDYADYAYILFERFHEKVKYWMTFNEPWALSGFSYDLGVFAPGRCSYWVNRKCRVGDSATEPYIVAHHILLAHAKAVKLYRKFFQEKEKEEEKRGKIGITLFTFWFEPLSNRQVDVDAQKTALDFMFGLWMDPLTYGRYPRRVQELVGDRLPKFSNNDIELLKKSYDFIGLQYYTARYANPNAHIDPRFTRYETDSRVNITVYDYNGNLIGPKAYSDWFYIFPKGIRALLKYTKEEYDNPLIYVTENGVDNKNDENEPIEEAVKDTFRIEYYKQHMWNVQKSIEVDKVNVQGYFAWSYIDNFEWNLGYTSRFGLYHVNYADNLKRTAKDSAIWFCRFINYKDSEPCKNLRPEENIPQVTLSNIIENTSMKARKLGKYYM